MKGDKEGRKEKKKSRRMEGTKEGGKMEKWKKGKKIEGMEGGKMETRRNGGRRIGRKKERKTGQFQHQGRRREGKEVKRKERSDEPH